MLCSQGVLSWSLPSPCSNVIEMRREWKEAFQGKHGVKLGFMSPFVKAACHALLDQPIVNAGMTPHLHYILVDHIHFLSSVIDGSDILYRDYVDISVAVATPKVCKPKYSVYIRTLHERLFL